MLWAKVGFPQEHIANYCPSVLRLAARRLLLALPGPDGRQPAGDHLHHQPPEQLQRILPSAALGPGLCAALPGLPCLHASEEETNTGFGYDLCLIHTSRVDTLHLRSVFVD